MRRDRDVAAEFLGLESFEFEKADQLQRRWDAGAGNAFQLAQDYPPMGDDIRGALAEFFVPYNQQLYRLIGEDYDWA